MNPVDRGNQPLSSYLLRILIAIINQSGGEVKVPAVSMLEGEGQGIVKHYDRVTRELIIRAVPVGGEALFIKEGDQWPVESKESRQPPQSSEAALTPPPSSRGPSPSSIHRTDEMLADLEMSRERERLSREAEAALINFPEAPTSPGRQPRQPGSRVVQEPFYKH